MSEDDDVSAVAGLLADDTARTILEATAEEPLSADELAERCDASPPTIYRRLDELAEHGLVEEQLRPEEAGHHYRVYAASLDRATIDLTSDGLELELALRDRMADRFTHLIEGMR